MFNEIFFISQKKEFERCKPPITTEKTPFLKLYTMHTKFMVSKGLYCISTLLCSCQFYLDHETSFEQYYPPNMKDNILHC